MSFESSKPFSDNKSFPRGIRRSGEFTITEARLLENHGCAMQALYEGTRAPADELEAAFVEQTHTKQNINNAFAKVWLKYLKITGPKKVHRLCGSVYSSSTGSDYYQNDFDSNQSA